MTWTGGSWARVKVNMAKAQMGLNGHQASKKFQQSTQLRGLPSTVTLRLQRGEGENLIFKNKSNKGNNWEGNEKAPDPWEGRMVTT